MSFSSHTKDELCKIASKKRCCENAALGGWIHTAGSLQLRAGNRRRVFVQTESSVVARWGIAVAKALYSVDSEIHILQQAKLKKKKNLAIYLSGDGLDEMLIGTGIFQRDADGINVLGGILPSLIEADCCKCAYMRGMFLGCGSLSDPHRAYHLEFVVRNEELAKAMEKLLNYFELNAKIVLRKGIHVVYLKEGDKIIEFLKRIGASGAILEFENIRAYKDFRNDLNRKVNCETANIQKIVTAATRQIENIQYLMAQREWGSLNGELRDTAEIRVRYPDATLAELGEMLNPPVGKSGVNHRLRKMEKMAEALRKNKEETKHDPKSIGSEK